MNLRDLEYLVAIDEFKHFRKAAEKCFVSQPTLSGQLKKLEEYLGVQLVERSNRKVLLTPIGEIIVKKARTILAEVDEIENVVQSLTDPMGGSIQIGLIPTVAPYLLPFIIGPVNQAYPQLDVVLFEVQTEVMLTKIYEGRLDAGILATPIETKGLHEIILYNEPFYVAVYPEHPLALENELTPEALQNETLLLLEEGHCLRGQALDICASVHTQEKNNFRGTSLETIRHMVAVGSGITLIPQLAINNSQSGQQALIRYIPFKNPIPSRRISLVFRQTSYRETSFQNLAALIQKIIAQKIPEFQSTKIIPIHR